MTIIEALISGFVQGITEFLPVSSSGHLVLVHRFFGFKEPNVFFDICLHAATLGAVILYFGRDICALIKEKNIAWFFYIAIGTVPAVGVALLFENRISGFFTDPRKVAFMLILTALALFLGQMVLWKRLNTGRGPTVRSSLLVGAAQALALLPGISRSGMTISAGLLGGMKAEEAFRFSFLLSIPIIAGAVLYKALTVDVAAMISGNSAAYAYGMASAFVAGIISLRLLWWIIRGRRLYVFGIYCFLLGAAGTILLK
jgi:undecaprenyl-diphosphatase